MQKHNWIAGLVCAALLVSACGKSEGEKRAEEVAKAVQDAAKAAEAASKGAGSATDAAAKGLDALTKGLQGLGAGADGKPVEPVSFKELQTLFPDLDGWEKGKPTGERMAMPVAFSQAEVKYKNGDSRIQMKIVDSGLNQLLMVPYTMFLTAGYEKETSDGYEKSTQVAGQPGWEKWDTSSKRGEVNAVVAKRFLVQIEGHEITDTKLLHAAAAKIDLSKLASMAK